MMVAYLALLLAQVGGNQEFAVRCAACHGADGRGGERGPAIVLRIATIVAFVRSLGESREESPVSLELRNRRTVSFADLVEPKPGDWPTYHGRLGGNRHSPLRQIDTGNVTGLAPKWMFPIPGSQRLQVTPVVVDGVMLADEFHMNWQA
jgi:glucose dehydrogenase